MKLKLAPKRTVCWECEVIRDKCIAVMDEDGTNIAWLCPHCLKMQKEFYEDNKTEVDKPNKS